MIRCALGLVFVATFATWLFRRAGRVHGDGLDSALLLGFGLALLAIVATGRRRRV